ncbi:hypothetical protein FGO68_gene3724 [Halteria grandinella]|uniref:Uncharacterized protein n=1 Tax=Halteria grandinella TaxID=5974 RepID=A0A8J8P882_HALGN|nr:hypothetical protein FGO68_gene3724 [Halteria grandinella]
MNSKSCLAIIIAYRKVFSMINSFRISLANYFANLANIEKLEVQVIYRGKGPTAIEPNKQMRGTGCQLKEFQGLKGESQSCVGIVPCECRILGLC